MSLDANSLLSSLLVSSVGMVLFLYGKRQTRLPHLLTGIILMVYPYFVPAPLLMFTIAGVLCVALWLVVKLGW